MIKIRTPDTEAAGRLVRAERRMPVQELGQVPSAGEHIHPVRVEVGELDLATEEDQKACADQVACL